MNQCLFRKQDSKLQRVIKLPVSNILSHFRCRAVNYLSAQFGAIPPEEVECQHQIQKGGGQCLGGRAEFAGRGMRRG